MFAGFVARMEDTRLPKCVTLEEMMGGAGCVEGQEKKWMGCFLDDLRAFGINADQWTTAVQDEGEWRRTVEQGAERFVAKWIAVEKSRARLRHTVVVVVIVVVSHIRRIGCQPEVTTYTVANPARGLLNREKRTKEKFWQHTPHPTRCSFGENK